jgi:hypothetical protein
MYRMMRLVAVRWGSRGVMLVEAHLLDHVSDVRPSEGEVLESHIQTMVGSQVADSPPMPEETLA